MGHTQQERQGAIRSSLPGAGGDANIAEISLCSLFSGAALALPSRLLSGGLLVALTVFSIAAATALRYATS